MTPKGGATSSAVATMPGSVRRRRFPMNAVMAPARARAAAAAAKEPTVTITSASASPPRKADHDERRERRRDERHQAERRERLGVARERSRDEIGRADLVTARLGLRLRCLGGTHRRHCGGAGHTGVPGRAARHPAGTTRSARPPCRP